ncbi:MAG: sulfatase-like hydrolase/transferase [Gemmataceae bacterium]
MLIVADDQAWTDFGFMGHDVVRTPHLDRLSKESATFVNGYVPTSLCRASLATLLTGQFAHQHRICCNDPPDGVDRSAMHPFIQRRRRGCSASFVATPAADGQVLEGHYKNAGSPRA